MDEQPGERTNTGMVATYRSQTLVTRGVAIFTDAMRALVRRELEARYGLVWWHLGVWPHLSPNQRKLLADSRGNDRNRPLEDLLDANHLRAVLLEPEANYVLFAH